MKIAAALLLVPIVLAACATDDGARYRVGGEGATQSRVDAERAHAEAIARATSRDLDAPPKVIKSVFPQYPQDWRNANVSGRVIVDFTIGEDGKVSDPSVRGSPRPELTALVLHAILQWRFEPAMKNGKPLAIRARQEFSFTVTGP